MSVDDAVATHLGCVRPTVFGVFSRSGALRVNTTAAVSSNPRFEGRSLSPASVYYVLAVLELLAGAPVADERRRVEGASRSKSLRVSDFVALMALPHSAGLPSSPAFSS